jgi:hypothetical protein
MLDNIYAETVHSSDFPIMATLSFSMVVHKNIRSLSNVVKYWREQNNE